MTRPKRRPTVNAHDEASTARRPLVDARACARAGSRLSERNLGSIRRRAPRLGKLLRCGRKARLRAGGGAARQHLLHGGRTHSVRGLGGVEFTAHGVVLDPAGPCPGAKLTASFSTERGTIAFAGNAKGCVKAVGHGDYDATISGTGAFAGASGSATVVHQANDNWVVTGTVNAPAVTFDLTPPKLAGLVNQTVKAKEGKRPTKVRFAVTANDSVDGKLRAACTPASGTAFRVGRTRVTCTATDRSGNTATGSFTVTVR
ncbi:MAG: HYR domain-containing protein [Gaiellaceae bacterium]